MREWVGGFDLAAEKPMKFSVQQEVRPYRKLAVLSREK